ncbi:MAG: hypothetical protein J6S67_09725 [Methanobrevibacter sp.]|nr:hypothetical protein [Methanobrevibacter sp.]
MKIAQFTKNELELFRRECNFTDLEMSCFNLKAKNCTNVELAMKLNICDSTVSSTMKSVRAKITAVLEQRAIETPKNDKVYDNLNPTLNYLLQFVTKFLENTPLIPESHSIKEWAEMPDRVSIKDKFYVVSDYRTDDNSPSVPRFKYGDGITMISKLPFCTAAITDNDVLWWDLKAQKVQ